MDGFISELNKDFSPKPEENVFTSIWNEYERVILQSLITSFGLDFLVQDQHGGDVDTIHNVREIGKDPNMRYKNKKNAEAYANREQYDTRKYHQDKRYIEINRKASESKKNGTLEDAYTGKTVARNAKMDLDHVVSAKEIHNDPGRILAGLEGTDLANSENNLKSTDRSINRSMQDKNIEDYLQKWEANRPQRQERINELKIKDSLSDKERKELTKLEKLEQIDPEKMRAENKKARDDYEKKLAIDYYIKQKSGSGASFIGDTTIAMGKRGAAMGLRQAMGFVFMEIWMAAKEEIQALSSGKDLKDILEAVATGVKRGTENAKAKYKEFLAKFKEGFLAGALASLTTTICNIFFTTAKNLVKCIRQIYASVIQAGKVLLFNPDNLSFGDRMKTTITILATGASVLVGSVVGELMSKTPIATIPEVGPVVVTFCSSLVSGLLSCTLLIFLDRSKFINDIINGLNELSSLNGFQTVVDKYREIADAFERLAAKLESFDIEKFRAETEEYSKIATKIGNAGSEQELNNILHSAYKIFNIKIPWKGDFDSFMGNKSNHLVFE